MGLQADVWALSPWMRSAVAPPVQGLQYTWSSEIWGNIPNEEPVETNRAPRQQVGGNNCAGSNLQLLGE